MLSPFISPDPDVSYNAAHGVEVHEKDMRDTRRHNCGTSTR